MNKHKCKRCGRVWETPVEEPKACRWCGSRLWDKERVRGLGAGRPKGRRNDDSGRSGKEDGVVSGGAVVGGAEGISAGREGVQEGYGGVGTDVVGDGFFGSEEKPIRELTYTEEVGEMAEQFDQRTQRPRKKGGKP